MKSPIRQTGPLFLDSNIPMYAVGAPSPYKEPCVRLLEAIAKGQIDAVTNAEVFQEILYRYHALQKPQAGIDVSIYFRRCIPNVWPVLWDDVELTMKLLHQYKSLKPRDALHAAIALNHGLTKICSADADFDQIREVERIDPRSIKL